MIPVPRQEESPIFMKGTPPSTSFPVHPSRLIENQQLVGSFPDWSRWVSPILLRIWPFLHQSTARKKWPSQSYKPTEDGDCSISRSQKDLDALGEFFLTTRPALVTFPVILILKHLWYLEWHLSAQTSQSIRRGLTAGPTPSSDLIFSNFSFPFWKMRILRPGWAGQGRAGSMCPGIRQSDPAAF